MGAIFFASDFHLGLRGEQSPRAREVAIIEWLRSIEADCDELYLLGDIFDFWYEYRRVAPRGFVRFLAQLGGMVERGCPVHILTGNHDVWIGDYLPQELGVSIHRGPFSVELNGVRVHLAHGDGLGDRSLGVRILHWAFRNRVLQWLFSLIHPDCALAFGSAWSHKNRYAKAPTHNFRGDEEPVARYALRVLANEPVRLFLFGHLHMAVVHPLRADSHLCVLGDWISNNTFATLRGSELRLLRRLPGGETETLAVEQLSHSSSDLANFAL